MQIQKKLHFLLKDSFTYKQGCACYNDYSEAKMKNKELEILDFIAQGDDTITLDELCQRFDLNARSIRYYMDFISQELSEAKITLNRGTYSIGNIDKIRAYLIDAQNISSSTIIKKYRMLYTFIFEEHINLSRVSQELEISRVTAKQYFLEIEAKLTQYSLTTKTDNNGISLTGSEDAVRSIQLQTLLDFNKLSEIKRSSLNDLTSMFTDDAYFYQIDAFLKNVQNDLNSLLTDYSYNICRTYLIIAVRRIQQSKTIEDKHQYSFLTESSEFASIKKHIHILETCFDIHFNPTEIIRFTDLLIGSHYSFSTELKENSWFENNLLVTKLIANFSKYIGLNLNQDHLLYNSLMAHLKPTMYRMLHNIKLSDINTDEIIQRFADEFSITQRVLNELKFFTDNTADKDEIALVTLHFKAAVNRYHSTRNKQIKVLIVCSQGYGTSRLLEQQLNEVYSVEILDCIPSHFLPFYENLDEINLIITTIKELTSDTNIPIMYVNPILNSDDFKRLDHSALIKRKNQMLLSQLTEIIGEHSTIQDRKKLVDDLIANFGNILVNDLESSNYNLIRFLPIDNILVIEEKIDWQTAISLCGDMLVNNGFVHEDYAKNMITAFGNYGSYMVIDDGIAIPHAKSDDTVYQTGIVLTICKQPVLFNDEKQITSFFAFCSVDHQEHLDALVAISNLVRETNYKESVIRFKDEREVLNFIHAFAMSDSTQ